jgi:hypothetical protein
MGKFTTNPGYIPLADGKNWRLESPLVYYRGMDEALLIVPTGFVTDFASVPRIAWAVLPAEGKYDSAACLHDYLYRTHKFSQSVCDDILREAMQSSGVPAWQVLVIYWGVHLFGHWAYAGQPSAMWKPGRFGQFETDGKKEDH